MIRSQVLLLHSTTARNCGTVVQSLHGLRFVKYSRRRYILLGSCGAPDDTCYSLAVWLESQLGGRRGRRQVAQAIRHCPTDDSLCPQRQYGFGSLVEVVRRIEKAADFGLHLHGESRDPITSARAIVAHQGVICNQVTKLSSFAPHKTSLTSLPLSQRLHAHNYYSRRNQELIFLPDRLLRLVVVVLAGCAYQRLDP